MQEDQALRAGNDASPGARIFPGVFLTSMAVLLLEISLTRIFSYTIWYHFTYVTISLAMLGFGASGAVLASSEKLARKDIKLAQYALLIAAASVPLMLIVISKVPFSPFQLLQEPVQVFYLIIYYLAVTLPFFCAGLTLSCVFKSKPTEAPRIYFWDLLGAGAACLIIVYAIRFLGVPQVAAISAVSFLLACAFFITSPSALKNVALAACMALIVVFGLNIEKFLQFSASKEKWISQIKSAKIEFTKWSPIFRIDTYKVTLTSETGYDGALYGIRRKFLPEAVSVGLIAHDGDACALMLETDDNLSMYKMFEYSILKVPYLLLDRPDALVIGPGGGVDVGMALQSGAKSVLAVELDPVTVDLVKNKYADFVGHLYQQPGVRVVADEGRSFLRRSKEKFDIIQASGVDTLSALNSGAYVLAENYLYTTEAYVDFMGRLNPNGILSMAVFDYHYTRAFPRQVGRQVSLSLAALKERGIQNPQNHIAVVAASRGDVGIPYVIILTKMSPLTFADVRKITDFSEETLFDVWYVPGQTSNNQIAQIIVASDAERDEFYKNNPLQLTATTDDAPFFFHYYKWRTLLNSREIDTGHTMATGQLILLLVLVFSIVFSAILIIFPLLVFQRKGLQTEHKWNYILYFAALGLGFIFLEISYIQRFILFLGYPTNSLTVILFSLLTFSGVGSYLSGRLPVHPRKLIGFGVIALAVVALGYMALLPPIFNAFLGSAKQVRVLVTLILLFPLGVLLGMFFPTGIRIISEDDNRFVPWAWGVNGCASVIGTVLAIVIAMSYGFSTVTVLAVVIYVAGAMAMLSAIHPADKKAAPAPVLAETTVAE